jgi:hypothetical protein
MEIKKKYKDRGEENPSSLLCFKSIELNFIWQNEHQ